MSHPTFDILIPAYNAVGTLPVLLNEIDKLKQKPEHVLVVDDGSTDGMKDAVRKNTVLLIHPENFGKGRALKTGFNWFVNKSKAEFLCCMDADLQHKPADIANFLKAIRMNANAKVFIGNRHFSGNDMPVHRMLSNKLTSWIISILTGFKIRDSQCGYRFIHRDILEKIRLDENGFQLESEFFFQIAEKQIQPVFVNIITAYEGNGSHMHHVGDTLRFVKLITREIYRKWFTHANRRK